MALTPLALIGCGDDDDNPVDTKGSGGSAGTAGNAGSAGGDAGTAGTAGTAGGGLTCSTDLTRKPGQACGDSQLVCVQRFTFPDAPGIREVQLQGALIPDTSWVTGAYMKKDGANWVIDIELEPGTELEHRFYVLKDGDAWNFGTNTDVVKTPPVSCGTPVCATNQNPWAAEAKRAKAPPPPPAAGAPFDWRDAVFYFTFVDRFYNGNTANDGVSAINPDGTRGLNDYLGGDFEGVTKKINENYFNSLGVNALWVTVPFNNTNTISPTAPDDFCAANPYDVGCYAYTGYHGYWPLDQWPAAAAGAVRTEEHFGNETQLNALVAAAHAKGIKVVFDYAMVHVHEESNLYKSFLSHVTNGTVDSLGIDETWFTPKFAVDENGDYIFPKIEPNLDTADNPNDTKITGITYWEYDFDPDGAGPEPVVKKKANYHDFPAPQLALANPSAENDAKYLPPGVTTTREGNAGNFGQTFFECNCNGDTTKSICNWDGYVNTAANISLPTIGERCWFQGYLPHLNYKDQVAKRNSGLPNPPLTSARNYSLDAAVLLAKQTQADGYRLDAVKHIDRQWYTEVRTRITNEVLNTRPGERFYLVGETYDFNGRYNLDRFIDPATMLDGQFDFPFRAQLARAVLASKGSGGGNGTWKSGLDTFARFMHSNDNYYGGDAVMSTWIGNHDVGRPIHIAEDSVTYWDEYADGKGRAWTMQPGQPTAREPYERLANAFAVMMTNPGAPLIYYGDEYGLAGAGDPDNRRMLFGTTGVYEANEAQRALFARVTALTKIRRENPALRYGTRTTLNASSDVWIYKMSLAEPNNEVIVALNRSDAEIRACGDIEAGAYTNLIDGSTVQGGEVVLPARQTLILKKQ